LESLQRPGGISGEKNPITILPSGGDKRRRKEEKT